ncbi:hypothetical protein [Streptomyces sp. NPDC058683]|uniref:hypothetical protein n=1 Tax=Streptomyces sp. NPDC058683 TaxID=3346597 RepID=UPI003667F89A
MSGGSYPAYGPPLTGVRARFKGGDGPLWRPEREQSEAGLAASMIRLPTGGLPGLGGRGA